MNTVAERIMSDAIAATVITRENVDAMLDSGRIECAMRNGNWWRIRRNGATKRWKKDPTRIRIPFKMGLYGYGAIEESDFVGGVLRADYYRAVVS